MMPMPPFTAGPRLLNRISAPGTSPGTGLYPRPILIVQGEQDQYGTIRQIEIARDECYCPVEVVMLPDAKHVPHREAPQATLEAIVDFTRRALG